MKARVARLLAALAVGALAFGALTAATSAPRMYYDSPQHTMYYDLGSTPNMYYD